MNFRQLTTPELKSYFPLVAHQIAAGFPSPADDFIEKEISLDELLIQNPHATYFAKVKGDCMQDYGIFDGTLVVVDYSKRYKPGDLLMVSVDGEFFLKQFRLVEGKPFLLAANNRYAPIALDGEQDTRVYGVIVATINLPELWTKGSH